MFFYGFTLYCVSCVLFTYAADSGMKVRNDKSFLLWCGAVSCKEKKREEVEYSSRSFLGVDDSEYPKSIFFVPGDVFHIEIKECIKAECLVSTSNVSKKEFRYRDTKGNIRWRGVSSCGNKFQERFRIGDFLHINPHPKHGCDLRSGLDYSLYGNSLIVNKKNVLSAATCADSSGKMWISCKPIFPQDLKKYLEGLDEATECSIRFFWVEDFKEPLEIGEIKIPVGSYGTTNGTIAVKFGNDDAEFQVYYNPSGQKVICKEESPPLCLQEIDKMIGKNLPPVKYSRVIQERIEKKPIIITYALNRIRHSLHKISDEILIQWHQAFLDFKAELLPKKGLEDVRKSMATLLVDENDV